MKKTELQKEAYNIENITDDVYIINSKMKTYSKVDVEMYHNILNGNMRFHLSKKPLITKRQPNVNEKWNKVLILRF